MGMESEQDRNAARLNQLYDSLTNQTPSADAVADIEDLRGYAKSLGAAIIGLCPETRERSLALTALEESVMWAVKSLVLPR